MSRCTDMRWKIPQFLNGDLPGEMMEEVREHLDRCPDCAVALAHPARVEAATLMETSALPQDFTEKLLERLPVSFTGTKLAYMIGLALILSGAFGAIIWAGIRNLLGGSRNLVDTAATYSVNNGGMFESLFSSATLQYLGIGLAATLVCFLVILIVDGPRGNRQSARSKS